MRVQVHIPAGAAFLQKPFSLQALAAKVQEVLEASAAVRVRLEERGRVPPRLAPGCGFRNTASAAADARKPPTQALTGML